MTDKNTYLFPILCVLIIASAMACRQERQPCLIPKTANMVLDTKHRASDTSTVFTDSLLSRSVFFSLTRTGSKGTLYAGPQASFNLSLSPDTSFCQWALRADSNGMALAANPFDTISFYYQRNRQFLSNACGFTYFFSLDSVHTTHRMIDSVRIVNYSVTNNVNTPHHIQVYIHPAF